MTDERKYRGVFEKVAGSGVWWIQYFDAEGGRHREKAGTLGTAKKLVELRRTQRLEGRKLPKPRSRLLLFRELTDAALSFTEGTANHATNISRMKVLNEEFGNCAAENITPEQIEAWLESKTELALATKNRYIALLKLVYRLAERAQRIKYNPARLVRQAKENNARIRWLTDKEEAALRKVIQRNCPDRILEFEIALHAGMRRSEQYGMECGLWISKTV
jgi:hypothetical protein